jgi:protein involved in polysaccharide export with SLBB domain
MYMSLFRPIRGRFASVATVAAVLILSASPSSAQTPPPPGTSPAQIQQQIDALGLRTTLRNRLTAMGLTDDQVRARLSSMGYDPASLDPYLDERVANPPAPSESLLNVLRTIGVLEVPAVALQTEPDRSAAALDQDPDRLRVFGLDVFARSTTQFQPVTTGAVPDTYVLGPGDEIALVITGDVEFQYLLPVTREGFFVVPQVGQIWVNGLTLGGLREQMYSHLGRVYSGVSRSPDATTRFDVSLGRLRTNQVFVTGEVAIPGTYLVSPVASLLNALYLAGGPTANCSFRDVQVMRGGRVAHRVDLYDYLLRGNNLDGIRLEPGDVIYIPVHGEQVAIHGEVVRPAIFEMKQSETLLDLMRFAGGPTSPAQLRRVRIERILPESQRTPGVDRVVIDVSLADIVRNPASAPPLNGGDDVRVFAVRTELRNTVALQGSAWQPGSFAFRPGMRLWDLISAAGGLQPDAYLAAAQITRLDPSDSTLSVIPTSLDRDASGAPVSNPELQEFDVVTIVSQAEATETFPVTISGEVMNPHQEQFRRGLTLRQLVTSAGGLKTTADLELEIARVADPASRAAGGIATVLRVRVDSTFFVGRANEVNYFGARDSLGSSVSEEFLLQPYDRVYVRRLPDFELPRGVIVTGEVRFPGAYALSSKDERVGTFLQSRVGGFSTTAFTEGFQFYRNGRLVDVDLPEVLKHPDRSDNLRLLAGDSLHIPEYNPIVSVQGAVNSPAAVTYVPGKGLSYYIESAGGYARNADEDRVFVRFANGRTEVKRKAWGITYSTPEPGPGSVVVVSAEDPADKTDVRGLVGDIVQILAAVTTVVIVATRN